MNLNFLRPKVKPRDIGEFAQKLAVLLDIDFDQCAAVEVLLSSSLQKRGRGKDRSTEGIRRVSELLIQSLREGNSLHASMRKHSCFREYAPQVEVGERTGKTSEILYRISDQIKRENKLMLKLYGALGYPIFTMLFAIAAAIYLFSAVIPQMMSTLLEIEGTSMPPMTQMVMDIGNWVLVAWKPGAIILVTLFVAYHVYNRTIGKVVMAYVRLHLPFAGKILTNISLGRFFRSWQQMMLAGAEMSDAMLSAADAAPNLYIRELLIKACNDFADNGVLVQEALRNVPMINAMELQAIQVAIVGTKLAQTLEILADDREFEADNSVSAAITAINPIMTIFVGLFVGVIVMAVYAPIISFSNVLS